MIGQKATYQNKDVTITGYVEWGTPTKVKYFWVKFKGGSEEFVKAKYVTVHKT